MFSSVHGLGLWVHQQCKLLLENVSHGEQDAYHGEKITAIYCSYAYFTIIDIQWKRNLTCLND